MRWIQLLFSTIALLRIFRIFYNNISFFLFTMAASDSTDTEILRLLPLCIHAPAAHMRES